MLPDEVVEAAEAACVLGAVNDLVHRHLLEVRVAVLCDGRALVVRVVAVVLYVRAHPELAMPRRGAPVRAPHVVVNLGYRHVEVEPLRRDGAREQHDKDGVRGVLEISQVQLHRAELDAPVDVVLLRRRDFEAHGVPVGGLEVLKVIVVHFIVEVKLVCSRRTTQRATRCTASRGIGQPGHAMAAGHSLEDRAGAPVKLHKPSPEKMTSGSRQKRWATCCASRASSPAESSRA